MKRHDGGNEPQMAGSSEIKVRRAAATSLAAGVATTLVALLGLGFAGASGCGATDESRDPGEAQGPRESVGEAHQAAVATPVACLKLQRGGPAKAQSTHLSLEKPATNFGASSFVLAGASGIGDPDRFRGLFKFETALIPPNATVISATLSLTQTNNGAATAKAYLALAPWDEAVVTWNSFGNSYNPVPFKSFNTASGLLNLDVLPQVQAWVNGAAPNYGFMIDQAGPSQIKFRSEEWPVVGQRPSLAVCYRVDCSQGTADCNGVAADACEVNTNSPNNCGGCGNVCPPLPHASVDCPVGACAIGACDQGFGNCDGDAQNGCEASLTTNVDCGACGVPCAFPNAASSCAAGSCALVACNPGFANCDGDAQNGCEPSPCADGGHCVVGADCAGGVCQAGVCAASACNDQAKNGAETDVDCGGPTCPPCGVGLLCGVGADCASGVCVAGHCAANNCADGVKNGTETDVDCGGPGCGPCAVNLQCAVGSDCQSGLCQGGLCQAASCNDGLKNGSETGVDCGGSCAPCAPGNPCFVNADCQGGVCLGNVCQMASCADGVKNGSETDVDCGGTCPPCNPNQLCAVAADCASNICVGGHCQPATCNDGVKNGNETGVDCGGTCVVPEVCNGVDDDCNGSVDDGLGTITCGFGACQVTVPSCFDGSPTVCITGQPNGEICDGALDDDCDGVVDNGCDCINGQTQGCYGGSAETQDVGVCHAGTQTCAFGQWGACDEQVTPTAEACNGLDDDCNGSADEGLGSTICGVGTCQAMVQNCVNGQAQICVPGDAGVEACDGLDNDCNGQVDDDLPTLSCGVGACQVNAPSCVNGEAAACTPGSPSEEACDGVDNDCDGQTDEGNPGGGQACNSGLPGACSGGATLCAAGQVVCAQTIQATAEVCDGLDNDCDGQTDEGNPGGGQACNTGLHGVCSGGGTICSAGQLSCNQTLQATAEVCDGIDNDCDGMVDEGNPGGGGACVTGQPGVCSAGTQACVGGAIVCFQNIQSSVESCDGADNDCDGTVDETCGCADGATQPCYGGPDGTQGVGLCKAGVQTCAAGVFGACVGAVTPGAEACDGADNDCDGQTDEGLGTVSCGVGACAVTVPACANGQPNACTPGVASAEICDGLDNDCNGQSDDNVPSQACNTGLQGVCSDGATACVGAALICVQTTPAAGVEDCANALDDTCNGVVNEGCVCVPSSTAACYDGPANTNGVGLCHAGTKTCNVAGTAYGACTGQVTPAGSESCGTVGDDDCDGQTNEGCVCVPFASTSCYDGPAGTAGVGLCKNGTKTCNAAGTAYGACTNQVVPAASESCHTVGDDNCNGQTNEGCAAQTCNLFTETFDPAVHPQNTAHYKADWCDETTVPSSNMPLCMAGTRGMRTNGSSSSAQLWVYRGTSSCTGVKISYQWYQFASSTSSLQYRQNSDSSFATCPSGSFTTAVTAAAQSALQVCSSTNNIVIPFSANPANNSVYIKFNNGNFSNNAMWYDNVVVQLVGCPCN